jgi:adenosyl cobinamide kinase/adenosyl cobinamide phosphate guanylyltransferase
MGEHHNLYPESFWKTIKESITKVVGDEVITREISIGMTVKSDTRAPSPVMYDRLTTALNIYMDAEHEEWLNQDKMIEFLNQNKVQIQQKITRKKKGEDD